MFKKSKFLDKLLNLGRKVIPRSIFKLAQPLYHGGLSMLGGLVYGFPSRKLKVIAVTGTKGKSTVVFMLSKIFDGLNIPSAAIGSLGYKINGKQWPNNLKMTTPGRMKLQKFLYAARRAGCKYVALEATSEGIAQNRLAGIKIDCAVFTNLHKEHIESHGSFENYTQAKQKLFFKTKNIHIINLDDPNFQKFINIPSRRQITYGLENGDVNQKQTGLNLRLRGAFNIYNALAALSVAAAYGLDLKKSKEILEGISLVPGRMEFIELGQPFKVVIDYAHTPDSLEWVYKTLRRKPKPNPAPTPGVSDTPTPLPTPGVSDTPTPGVGAGRLICVLGAAGGGRDKWKRPKFGQLAEKYCGRIVLTNEDPYDENPEDIINQIASGFSRQPTPGVKDTPTPGVGWHKLHKILDRKEAIRKAIGLAEAGDTVIITGKGSETSMALSESKSIPWSDKAIVEELLKKI